MESLNVFGKKLELCSTNPMTGFYRNGCCDTGPKDYGTHTVCAVVTDEFLKFSKERGNDLTTENPTYNFKGLKMVISGVCVFLGGLKLIKQGMRQK